jgi:hypothetical protein
MKGYMRSASSTFVRPRSSAEMVESVSKVERELDVIPIYQFKPLLNQRYLFCLYGIHPLCNLTSVNFFKTRN